MTDTTPDHATPLDCRSPEGITVSLIDGLIATARILRDRDLSHPAVVEALTDLAGDEDLAWLTRREDPRDEQIAALQHLLEHWADEHMTLTVRGGGEVHADWCYRCRLERAEQAGQAVAALTQPEST